MSTQDRISVRIDTANAAFDEHPVEAIERVFADVIAKLGNGKQSGMLRDENGNTIGEFVWVRSS